MSRRVIHSYMLMRADEEELSTEAWDMVVRCVIKLKLVASVAERLRGAIG